MQLESTREQDCPLSHLAEEKLGQQDSGDMGLDSTHNQQLRRKGSMSTNLKSYHIIWRICSFCVPPNYQDEDIP